MNDVTAMPQSAVVVGGTSELAFSVLEELARRRLDGVVLTGREAGGLERTAARLRALGVTKVTTVVHDVRDVDGAQALAEAARAQLGQIDLVLVAAGALGSSEVETLGARGVADTITTNFTGPAALVAELAAVLRAQGSGRIVVLSSVAAVRARRANFVYGSSKAGLDAFCQGLGDALASSGIVVVVVRPGFVRTAMTASLPSQPFAAQPADVGRAVVAGLSRGAETIWVPGVLRAVFAVLRVAPRTLWRRLPQ
jgi:decaprenylphospho-beta-D-erythro-pentofuranosid-2-ulose 2-reductase